MEIMTSPTISIVTGATGAIGQAIAQGLAAAGHTVVLACRNEQKARRSLEEIRKASGCPSDAVRYELLDLGCKAEIDAFAARWEGPLHVLVNCAAIAPRQREETPAGIERQLAVNVLSYCWMIDAFTPHLKAGAPARVVNVASYWAGGLDLDDLEFRRRAYDNDAAYRQAKQANRMLSTAYAERLAPLGITVNACHPGDVRSQLSSDLGFGGHESPEEGAATPVWLATEPVGARETGKYFEHQRESPCRFSQNAQAVEALWKVCAGYSSKA